MCLLNKELLEAHNKINELTFSNHFESCIYEYYRFTNLT